MHLNRLLLTSRLYSTLKVDISWAEASNNDLSTTSLESGVVLLRLVLEVEGVRVGVVVFRGLLLGLNLGDGGSGEGCLGG